MGERKVLNKYYPPDFDPSLIPRARKPKNDQQTVRMMLPMSVRCLTCGEYLYRGKKFNAKKETVAGEEYLGIKIFRFYMKCTRCKGEFTIKTDPEKADYVAEHNVSRNFEPWRNKEDQVEEQLQKRQLEEEGDVMKQLENRTMDSKVELDILDALADIKSLNTRNARLDIDQVIEARMSEHELAQKRAEEEDERLVQEVFHRRSGTVSSSSSDGMTVLVKRLEDDEDDDDPLGKPLPTSLVAPLAPSSREEKKKQDNSSSLRPPASELQKKRKSPFPIVAVVAKPKTSQQEKKVKIEPPPSPTLPPITDGEANDDEGGEGASLLGLDY